MDFDEQHPLYAERLDDWSLMDDAVAGERAIKAQRTKYLPASSAMIADGMGSGQRGAVAYEAYLCRAVFHDFVTRAAETLLGRLHHEPANIELPSVMESMLENAGVNGESLQAILREINWHQLTSGRVGMLADLPDMEVSGKTPPYIALYGAKRCINWDDGAPGVGSRRELSLVVLDESGPVRRSGLKWDTVKRHRILSLGPIDGDGTDETRSTYTVAVSSETQEDDDNATQSVEPKLAGKFLERLPFVFVNSGDTSADPSKPPLLALAELSLKIYQLEADYRQTLHMQGQETLVIEGGQPGEGGDVRTGAGLVIDVMQGGDAKYVGVSAAGLGEMRAALENDKRDAATMAAQLSDTMGGTQQSGEALATRVAASTAALPQIAKAGAEGLQSLLRIVAEWMGADPAKVIVTPNLDFGDVNEAGRQLVDLMTARNMGAPISLRSVHAQAARMGVTEMDFESETAEIEGEAPALGDPTGRGEPDDPEGKGGA